MSPAEGAIVFTSVIQKLSIKKFSNWMSKVRNIKPLHAFCYMDDFTQIDPLKWTKSRLNHILKLLIRITSTSPESICWKDETEPKKHVKILFYICAI